MSQKTVLHILSRFTTGGAERLVLAFVERADPRHYRMEVAAVREGIVRNILVFVKREKPDIVHTHLFSGDCMGYILKRVYPEIRWISTQHNVEAQTSFLRRLLWKFVLCRADAVVAVSAGVEAWCRDGFGVPEKKIRRIVNAIPIETFLALTPLSDAAPKVWELAAIGRLEKQKGHDILLAALAKITDLPWRLSIFGSGSQQEYISQMSRSLYRDERVMLKGVHDAAEIYASAHVVVQPSRWEGRSLAVMEAMAAGRCVVASEAAGAELIENGKTGIVVPVEDVQALADALRRLLMNPAEVARIGAAARIHAREHFGFDAWLVAMDELYQSV